LKSENNHFEHTDTVGRNVADLWVFVMCLFVYLFITSTEMNIWT